jgi:hypothetical protein
MVASPGPFGVATPHGDGLAQLLKEKTEKHELLVDTCSQGMKIT